MTQQLILICGLPGSGKTTLAKDILYSKSFQSLKWRWYENDHYFERDGKYQWDAAQMEAAFTWCQDSVKRSLDSGYSVIVSNTFTTYLELDPYFAMADRRSITPQIIVCHGVFGSIHDVPNQVISRMRERAWWRKL